MKKRYRLKKSVKEVINCFLLLNIFLIAPACAVGTDSIIGIILCLLILAISGLIGRKTDLFDIEK